MSFINQAKIFILNENGGTNISIVTRYFIDFMILSEVHYGEKIGRWNTNIGRKITNTI
jgi:hypothetical protein